MVHIKKEASEENFYSLPMQQPSPLHEFEADDKTIPENVDNFNIKIDSLELDEFCRNPNLVEIETSQRSYHDFEQPRMRFDAEIMSIIGNINKKNQQIRNTLAGSRELAIDQTIIPKTQTMDTIQEDEILKNMVMELSIDEQEEPRDERRYENNLEQTIIIGEMDEGTIFDDFNEKD